MLVHTLYGLTVLVIHTWKINKDKPENYFFLSVWISSFLFEKCELQGLSCSNLLYFLREFFHTNYVSSHSLWLDSLCNSHLKSNKDIPENYFLSVWISNSFSKNCVSSHFVWLDSPCNSHLKINWIISEN